MIALISTPCITPNVIPSGIALIKGGLVKAGAKAKCFYLANEFELQLSKERPDLSDVYCQASEIGSDYQNPYFSGLVFGHSDPTDLVKKAVSVMFNGRHQLPSSLDDTEVSEAELQSYTRKEISLGLSFCEKLKHFCEQQSKYVLSHSPYVVGFSCLSTQLFVALYMADLIKRENQSTSIVFGGGFLTRWNAELYSKCFSNVDQLIVDRNVARIAESLKAIGDRRRKSKVVISTGNTKRQHILAPDYSDITSAMNHARLPEVSIPLSNSYGCSWGRCVFCPAERESNGGKDWHPDTISAIVNEVTSKYGIFSFSLSEWEINSNYKKLTKFCEIIRNRGLRLHFWGEFSPASCTRQLFRAMTHCGRWCLQMGIESFSDDVLKLMGKRQALVNNIKALRLALEEGIGLVSFNLIHGFPGTRARHVRETQSVIRKISHLLCDSRISVSMIPFYRYRKQHDAERGPLVETHYLPTHLRKSFPTQLLPHKGGSHHLQLWGEVRDELDNLEFSYFCAFDASTYVGIEDSRENDRSLRFEALDADVLRCLLEEVHDCSSLARILKVPSNEVNASLELLLRMDIVAKSGNRFIALPMRA